MSLFFQRSCITFPISTGDPGSPVVGISSPPGTSPAVHGTHMKQLRIPKIQMIQ